MTKLLTKSKYLAGLQCSKLLWTLVHDKDNLPVPDASQQKIFDTGTAVGVLATSLYPDGIKVSEDGFMENINATKELLEKREPLFEAGFMVDGLFSRVDILRPNSDGSWDIVEVKSGTQVKEENIDDVSFQKHCLELSGLRVSKVFLCFINNQYVREGELDLQALFTLQDVTEEATNAQEGISERISAMKEVLVLPEPPSAQIGRQCDNPYSCDLKGECWGFLPKNHVFTLYRGGKTSAQLFESEIHAISDIPDDIKLTNNQAIQLECEQTGKPHIQPFEIKQFLDSIHYPIYHLDFETFAPVVPKFDHSRPYQRIPFQYSLHIEQEDGSVVHREFLAEGGDPRRAFLESLKSNLGEQGTVMVYNQSFEKGVLGELARDFPEYEEWVNKVLPRVVDLLVPFRNFHYYNPSQAGSASIKKVLPALTNLSYEGMDIADGMGASIEFERVTYNDVAEDDKNKVRAALLKYCEMDTLAEVRILAELKKLQGS